jgi:hypothetical protein
MLTPESPVAGDSEVSVSSIGGAEVGSSDLPNGTAAVAVASTGPAESPDEAGGADDVPVGAPLVWGLLAWQPVVIASASRTGSAIPASRDGR